ncbi:hypothetical protein I5R65_23960 [Herbaspirillum sp. AP02]|uniref:hypothetical protein n=1 Tax=unclassified Herbaspirillum TaxID=2624150 RepID=UPI0015DA2338|nr:MULTISPECIES: hypothetical protein [unclassified Herbaspirillum]MBG7622542.1 hypothetical protein [Herbaspirillum sp. AP02]NZD70472.1 hypothetical protein [Herbaspirillum sp. AP21]
MNNKLLACPLPACLAALTILCAGAAHAAPQSQSNGDPARWYQTADTPKERLRNLNQETAAAYAEALSDCKAQRGKQARNCRKEAAAARKDDNARARRIYEDYKATDAKPAS